MAAISSTVGMQAVAQSGLQQLKLQQARQNAERAEMTARSLQAQAAGAQREADRAQEKARSLTVQANQAQDVAGKARQGLVMTRSASEMGQRLTNTVEQASERMNVAQTSEAADKPTGAATAPVVNLAGQTTGTLVNTTA